MNILPFSLGQETGLQLTDLSQGPKVQQEQQGNWGDGT